ncbi:MAG: hypothetical protein ACW99F_08165 [Candidatus Hodarchaeales archaeon]|jgi:hypothetical protein
MEIEKLSKAQVTKLLADAPSEGVAKVILKDPKIGLLSIQMETQEW